MKKMIRISLYVLLAAFLLGLQSCGDDEETAPAQNDTPLFPDMASKVSGGVDGSLWAINIDASYYLGNNGLGGVPFSFDMGTAVGVFFNGSQNGVDAGTLNVNGTDFTFTNGAYVYIPDYQNIDPSQTTSLAFGQNVTWKLTAAKNGFTDFTHNDATSFPSVGSITSGPITAGQDYTVTISSVSNANGMIYLIAGGNNVAAIKTLYNDGATNLASATFSAAELSGLSKGNQNVLIQAVGFNYDLQDVSGKTIVFGKEKAVIAYVTVN